MRSASTKLNGYLVIAAAMVAMLHYFISPIPETVQWLICGIIIILTGIPHGALDHLVAKKNHALRSKAFSSLSFYLDYFGKMALFGMGWYFFPSASLVIFLVLSAFHFGETDLPLRDSHPLLKPFMLQTVYGIFILSVMVVAHQVEILPLIAQLAGKETAEVSSVLDSSQERILLVGLPLLLLSVLAVVYLAHEKPRWNHKRNIAYQTIAIITVVVLLPLPLAFAFYFGCWHSLNALSSIRKHLSTSMGRRISWKWMINQLLPYSILAITGIAVLVVLVFYTGNIQFPLLAAFIGLAVLTAPHLHVMSEMYKAMRK